MEGASGGKREEEEEVRNMILINHLVVLKQYNMKLMVLLLVRVLFRPLQTTTSEEIQSNKIKVRTNIEGIGLSGWMARLCKCAVNIVAIELHCAITSGTEGYIPLRTHYKSTLHMLLWRFRVL